MINKSSKSKANKATGIRSQVLLVSLITMLVMVLIACANIGGDGKNNKIENSNRSNNKLGNETIVCSIYIDCKTILDNMDQLDKAKKDIVPEDGVILELKEVKCNKGDSVFDVLSKVCKEEKILMESSFTPGTSGAYIEGIANLYEFDCGSLSGWQYFVNDEYVGVSCSEQIVVAGDVIGFRYTCNLGEDLK